MYFIVIFFALDRTNLELVETVLVSECLYGDHLIQNNRYGCDLSSGNFEIIISQLFLTHTLLN